MTLKEVIEFIRENQITIPNECWKLFKSFLGSQFVALGSTCIDPSFIDTQKSNQTILCLKEKIPHYDELRLMIQKLNKFKYGFFEVEFIEMYLVMAYISIAWDDKERLRTILISYASYVVVQTFLKYFKQGCNAELLRAAASELHNKSLYRKLNLNHIEVAAYIVDKAMELHKNEDDRVFRWMRNIKAHVNQVMKTLARKYYDIIKKSKDSFTYGGSSEVNAQTMIQTMMEYIPHALEMLLTKKTITNQLGIKLEDDQLECVVYHLQSKVETLRDLFVQDIRQDENFRKLVMSTQTCNQVRKVYNKLIYFLMHNNLYKDLFNELQKVCNLSKQHDLDIRKIIAVTLSLSWQQSVCS